MLKNKLFLFIFIGIFFIGLTSANLIIQTINPEINVNVGQTQSFSITLFNNYSFDIYDISFPELEERGFVFPQMDLQTNETKTFAYQVTTTDSYYGIFESNVEFNFLVDLPEQITTYNVGITGNGFNPTYKTIRQGDSINFINNDETSHTLISDEFGTITIPSNSSSIYTYNNIGEFNFKDQQYYIFNEFNGRIEVINRTESQKAHNPNYDTNWIINLNSVGETTTLEIVNSKENFEINNLESKKGVLTITNTGNVNAEIIQIKSNSTWISFSDNGFSLSSGDPEGVTYTITPYLTETNQTNQTYNLTISIKGANTEEYNKIVSVFIPYKEINLDFDSDLEYQQYLYNVYCVSFPCSLFCSPELPKCNVNGSSNSSSSSLTANITAIDLYKVMSEMSIVKENLDRLLNNEKLFQETYGMSLEELLNQSNSSLSLQIENSKKHESNSNTIWWIILFVVIMIPTSYFLNELNKKAKKKSLLGTDNYRQ